MVTWSAAIQLSLQPVKSSCIQLVWCTVAYPCCLDWYAAKQSVSAAISSTAASYISFLHALFRLIKNREKSM